MCVVTSVFVATAVTSANPLATTQALLEKALVENARLKVGVVVHIPMLSGASLLTRMLCVRVRVRVRNLYSLYWSRGT